MDEAGRRMDDRGRRRGRVAPLLAACLLLAGLLGCGAQPPEHHQYARGERPPGDWTQPAPETGASASWAEVAGRPQLRIVLMDAPYCPQRPVRFEFDGTARYTVEFARGGGDRPCPAVAGPVVTDFPVDGRVPGAEVRILRGESRGDGGRDEVTVPVR
ncbi:MAG: hypothetical protein Q4E05_04410 [Pseudoclavibacter sp.]|nr:hypothetical protein [Pseudoclavibacter sp.]